MSSTVYDWGSMPEPIEPVLPRAVALAWGVAANPQRGPKRELSIERIVDVAVELADAGGLSAVSMSSVATALGFTPMSLYRYVTAKDDLLVLMQERGIGVPPESVNEVDGWRARLHAWSRGDAADLPRASVAAGHPGRRHPARRRTTSPGWTARSHVLDETTARLSSERCRSCSRSWRRSAGRARRTRLRGAGEAGGDRRPTQLETSAGSADARGVRDAGAVPDRVPALSRGRLLTGPGRSDPFAFGLERVLDGVEPFLAAPRRHAAPPARPADPQCRDADRPRSRTPRSRDAKVAQVKPVRTLTPAQAGMTRRRLGRRGHLARREASRDASREGPRDWPRLRDLRLPKLRKHAV